MILITGGAGYVGSHVNMELSKRGYEIVVFDNLINGHRRFVKWGNFVLGDLKSIDQIRLVFQNYKIDAIMHFAAFAYVGESINNPEKYYVNNVVNTINLLRVMREYSVDKIIFSSTCATYGIPIEIPIDENHTQNPINSYGQSKLMIEKILYDFNKAYCLKYVSLRYFNAAGADIDVNIGELHIPETHLIPLILDAATGRRENIQIYGTDYNTRDGTCIRDYIHIIDLANAHILALEYLLNEGKSDVFNLANGNGYSVKEVIETTKRITQKNIKVIEKPRRPGDPAILVGCSKKAKNVLGWNPKYFELDDIIRTAWNWHKKI